MSSLLSDINQEMMKKRKRTDNSDSTSMTRHKQENNQQFIYNPFMEVKSIESLMAEQKQTIENNSYEIIRKPPKKKLKHNNNIEENCYINDGLNLNGPENIINPFEIKRTPPKKADVDCYCFRNDALDVRVADKEVTNPFEIVRDREAATGDDCDEKGIHNPALDIHETTRSIGIPFTPTVGCRIDFSDIPLEALTPCTMLKKTLVFTPEHKSINNKLRSSNSELPVINEDEESVDISEELDCYQLELENSINENKSMEKRGRKKRVSKLLFESPPAAKKAHIDVRKMSTNDATELEIGNDSMFSDTDEPAPFVRTYRRSGRTKNPTKPMECNDDDKKHTKSSGIRQSVRRGLKKLFNHNAKETNHNDMADENINFLSNLRQSFRKKTKNPLENQPSSAEHNVSILIENKRQVFKQQTDVETKTLHSGGGAGCDINENGPFGRKTLRASLRRTTRGVLKSVFKHNLEGYKLE